MKGWVFDPERLARAEAVRDRNMARGNRSAAVSGLGRRLSALEQIAYDVHRREVRDLVLSLEEAADLTPDEIEEATTEVVEHLERLRSTRCLH